MQVLDSNLIFTSKNTKTGLRDRKSNKTTVLLRSKTYIFIVG